MLQNGQHGFSKPQWLLSKDALGMGDELGELQARVQPPQMQV
jgi:hypothetical protein